MTGATKSVISGLPCPVAGHAALIAAVLLVSFAYYYPGEGSNWNADSRFDLARAIVEQHTFRIDAYHENTLDKALWKGHFYSDKAPGLALTAVPAWEIGRFVLRLAGKDPSSERSLTAERYFSTLITVGLPGALAAASLFIVSMKLGASEGGAGFAAVAWGLATPFWTYATVFWGHAPAAACLVFAFTAAVALRDFHSSSRDWLLGAAVGLAAGWATVTELTSAPTAAILAVLALSSAAPNGRQRVFRVAISVAAAALLCVLVLMTYNALVFGSPFKLGYAVSGQQTFPWLNQGFMGVTYPKAHVLREILLGQYRGLLPLAPVLAVAPIGFLLLWKQVEARVAVLAAAAIAFYYVLFNASLPFWDGGWCYGPRYLSPALPFLCLPLAVLWTRSSRFLRFLLAILTLYSVFLTLVDVSTNIMPPALGMIALPQFPQNPGDVHVTHPMRDLLWPAFRAGHLSQNFGWNLGLLAGLPGLASLIPLVLVWAAAISLWVCLDRFRKNKFDWNPGASAPR